MKLHLTTLAAALLATACTAAPPPEPPPTPLPAAPEGSNGWQTLGEESDYGPKVTPLELVEDSRCPMNARCVWAGTVRVKTRISLAGGTRVSEEVLTLNEPVQIADGGLMLVAVLPENTMAEETIPPASYRFAYRFDGGL